MMIEFMPSKSKSEIYRCIERKIKTSDFLSDEIYSLIAYGSFERGDFIEGISDLDFFTVIHKDETIIEKLKNILQEYSKDIDYRMLDLTWEYVDNLDDPMNKCAHPWKFLTFYQKDFLENHTVIYGEEIETEIPRYESKELIRWRAEKLLDSCEEHKDDTEMLNIIAGEVCRLVAIDNNVEALRKSEVLQNLKGFDERARNVYEAYLYGNQNEFSRDYLIDFVESRCDRIIQKFDVNETI